MVNALVQFFNIQEGYVTLTCDNLGAITITAYEPNGVNPVSCVQFDMVMAIQGMKAKQIKWRHIHVDGHQDSVKDHVLSPIELINVEMDLQAKAHWTRTKGMRKEDRQHQFDDDPWNLVIANEKVVGSLGTQVSEWCQRPRIQGYWVKKERFEPDEFTNIDTEVAAAAL